MESAREEGRIEDIGARALERPDQLAVLRAHQIEFLDGVLGQAEQLAAVGGEAHPGDAVREGVEVDVGGAGQGVPDPNDFVLVKRDDPLTLGVHVQALDRGRLLVPLAFLARLVVPDADLSIAVDFIEHS